MGQVKLFACKGHSHFESHYVCPHEGSCLQKVVSNGGLGTDNFIVCCFESPDGTVGINSCEELNRHTVLAWMGGALESVEKGKKRWADCFLCVFPLLGDGGRIPIVPTIVKLHQCWPRAKLRRPGLSQLTEGAPTQNCSAHRSSFQNSWDFQHSRSTVHPEASPGSRRLLRLQPG